MSGPATRNKSHKDALSSLSNSSSLSTRHLNNDKGILSIKVLEDQLAKHSASLRHSFVEEMNKMRSEFFNKIEEVKVRWAQRFDSINNTISNIIARVDKIEENTSAAAQLHNAEILALRLQVNVLERREVASDAVLYGVPELPDENLTHLFKKNSVTLSTVTRLS